VIQSSPFQGSGLRVAHLHYQDRTTSTLPPGPPSALYAEDPSNLRRMLFEHSTSPVSLSTA
jgi:hypothetical protein